MSSSPSERERWKGALQRVASFRDPRDWKFLTQFPSNKYTCDPDEIGSGAFGTVYKCKFRLDDGAVEDVAIKEMDDEDDVVDMETEVNEVKNMQKVMKTVVKGGAAESACHPNVVCYVDHFQGPQIPGTSYKGMWTKKYIVTRFVDGPTLDDAVSTIRLEANEEAKKASSNPTTVRKIRAIEAELLHNIVRSALAGLAFLHDKVKIAHGDISVQNVLVRKPAAESVFIDLGLACRARANTCGKSHWSALPDTPEYQAGKYKAKRQDLWSLGLAMFEAFAEMKWVKWVDFIATLWYSKSSTHWVETLRSVVVEHDRFLSAVRDKLSDSNVEPRLRDVITDMIRADNSAAELLQRLPGTEHVAPPRRT